MYRGGFPDNVASYRAISNSTVQMKLRHSYDPTWFTDNEFHRSLLCPSPGTAPRPGRRLPTPPRRTPCWPTPPRLEPRPSTSSWTPVPGTPPDTPGARSGRWSTARGDSTPSPAPDWLPSCRTRPTRVPPPQSSQNRRGALRQPGFGARRPRSRIEPRRVGRGRPDLGGLPPRRRPPPARFAGVPGLPDG